MQSNTQELAKDKWLCPLSGKKFKGPDFVRKHIFNKHGEKVEEVKKEVSRHLCCVASFGGNGWADRGPEYLVGSVLGSLSCLMQHRGFDPPQGEIFSGGGDFSLGVNMGSDSIQKLSDESINRGLVCAHMHSIAQTQKLLTFMS